MRMAASVITVVFVFGSALAQTTPEPRHSDALLGEAAGLPDSEKLNRSATMVTEMKETLGHVVKLLAEAREEKDVIKLNCINEKLTSIKGLIRIADQAEMSLQEAVGRAEKDSSTHEYHKIVISHQKVKILRSEAEQCIGELAFAVGKTSVEVEVDKEQVPGDDPTEVELPDTPIVRPPAASPYQ